MTHYDDESLFQFAEGTSPIAGEIEAHVACCWRCAQELESHRDIVQALGTEDAWADEVKPAPKQVIMDVMAFAERAREEDAAATVLCDQILSGPSTWWATKLRQTEGVWTAGMVRQLLERVPRVLETSPAKAIEMTLLASAVAEELDVVGYPCDYVIKLRAQALRERAYALSFVGRFPEALSACDDACRLFEQVPLPEYDLARLKVVRSSILRSIDRIPEAIALTREAAETFERFGDRSRTITARMFEAAIVFQTGDAAVALSIWEELMDDQDLDGVTRVGVIHNVALCHQQLGRADQAVTQFRRCIDEYEMLNMTVERTRSRWNLGRTLVTAGRLQDAIPVLRQSWREFESLDIIGDSGLVALELAEALLLAGQPAEVPVICRDIVARFTRAGMTSRAITALSFLREAVALGQAQPSLVRHVYNFLRELPAERPRLYAPSPAGSIED
jgi:tetratricopeptide (TPR) repeat protein